ncbi:MAG: M48 family metalloprotease [Armatimonadetes bacterium]|nr:M48 family metalloprotease [Armatimonadota bacterium]MDW8120778.1 M48 family metalloprotease [Armatimonadota bacterium]
MRISTLLINIVAIVCLSGLINRLSAAPSVPPTITPEEARLGADAVKELEKQFKVVTDHPELPRLEGIIARILPFTERPRILYQVKVLEHPEPNALALPGGYLYVTTGLLKIVRSDDELAAVIAHEMAHISLFHAVRLIRKESRLSLPALIALIGAIVSRDETSAEVAQMVHLIVQIFRLGYSQEMEREADEAAFTYLLRAGYNPVGLLTFLEMLKTMEEASPTAFLMPGYWTTHPTMAERVNAVRDKLKQAGLSINRRPVTGALKVEAREVDVNGRKLSVVLLAGEELFRLDSADGVPHDQRAQSVVQKLDSVLGAGARPFQFHFQVDRDGLVFSWNKDPIVRIHNSDLLTMGQTPQDLARHLSQVVTRVFLRERLRGGL